MGKRYVENADAIYPYDDISLDPYIEMIDIIDKNADWIFLKVLTNFHDSFIFYDCNELSYRLYLYAKKKAIPYEIRIEKWWKVYGIQECQGNPTILKFPILINEVSTDSEWKNILNYTSGMYAE